VAQDVNRRTDAGRRESRPAFSRGTVGLLVVDASAVVQACLTAAGLGLLGRERLVAPPLLWSEAVATIHELRWRRDISEELGSRAFAALLAAPVRRRAPRHLHREAWRIADELGWAKTYDAEYVALARILGCRLLTLDERLRRGAGRLVDIISPHDL
jgi:predicted nucleic acid-binding protein